MMLVAAVSSIHRRLDHTARATAAELEFAGHWSQPRPQLHANELRRCVFGALDCTVPALSEGQFG